MRSRAADGFGAVAPRYDAETETNPLVRRVRRATLRRLLTLFRPGDLVLELGCGTGVEALALARAGVRVLATDVAPGMLEATAARLRAAGVEDRVRVARLSAAEVGTLLSRDPRAGADSPASSGGECPLPYAPGSFAGAYSSFGPLNCEPDLAAVAVGLHALVRPGGVVAISAINRYHPFEFAWYGLHGDWARAMRRMGGYAEGTVSPALPHRVPTYYYTPHAFARRFAPHFELAACRALLLFLPPPYLAHLVRRFPRTFHLAGRVEERVAGWPVLRALGDHFYVELVRR